MMKLVSDISKKIMHNKLASDVGIYTMGHVLNAAIPFLLMPILTRYLSPEDYGIIAMLSVLLGLYQPFIDLKYSSFVTVAYYQKDLDFSYVVSSGVCVLTIMVVFISIFTWLEAGFISDQLQFPVESLWAVVVICVTVFFISIMQNIQQVKRRAREYALIQIAQSALNFLLSIIFVIGFGMSWRGKIWGQVIAGLIFAAIAIVFLYRWRLMKLNWKWEYVYKGLSYGVPTIPHSLYSFFVLAADRVFISNLLGVGEVGVFSVGYSLGKVVDLLAASFQTAFNPWLFEKLQHMDDGPKDNRQQIVQLSYLCMGGFLLLSLIYVLCVPFVLSILVGHDFIAASQYIWGFALSSAIHAAYYIVVPYIYYTLKTHFLALLTFGSGGVHVCITYLFIQYYGGVGAAYASIITQVLILLATWWLSNKVYPMPWKLWKIDR